jgi:hypothetical protein
MSGGRLSWLMQQNKHDTKPGFAAYNPAWLSSAGLVSGERPACFSESCGRYKT